MSKRVFAAVLLLATIVVAGLVIGQGPTSVEEPSYDKPVFIQSAQSVARGDLLACRNKDAVVTKGSHASVADLAAALNGVWINRNGRTVHGRTVETDTAWYFDIRGNTGTAVLLDRNNMGLDTLTAPFADPATWTASSPLAIRQVNCTYEFVDEYIKVSDTLLMDVLATTTGLTPSPDLTLTDVWSQLKANGYWNYLNVPTAFVGGTNELISTSLGDGLRYGFTPEGARVTEPEVMTGLYPGAEYELPMKVGALFDITLTQRQNGPGGYDSVFLHFDAEYAGTGINMVPGESVSSYEQGEFVMEGGAFVSARSVSGADAYETGWCDDKNGLAVEGQVEGETEFIFERVVIGVP